MKDKKNKKVPEIAVFEQIKTGATKSGNQFAFCRYKGRGILISKEIVDQLDLTFDSESYKIGKDKIILTKSDRDKVLILKLRVPPKTWFGLEEVKANLKKGVKWSEIESFLESPTYKVDYVTNKDFGSFLSLKPKKFYAFNDKHRIHFYPGNSIKNAGGIGEDVKSYIEKNKERLIFRSFEKSDETVFYRFYLRKVKNSFKPNKAEGKEPSGFVL